MSGRTLLREQGIKTRRLVPGDTFGVALPDGRYGAVRVIRVMESEGEHTALVGVTPVLDDRIPSLKDPRLKQILQQHRGKFGGQLAVCWYSGVPTADFVHLGTLGPSGEESRIDAQGAYCGEWSRAIINPVFWERGEQPLDSSTGTNKADERDRVAGSMSDGEFWSVIGRLDWDQSDPEAIVAPAIKYLATLSRESIAGFQHNLAGKLFTLDREEFAREIGQSAYGGPRFSPDHFLDVRAAVVASGQEFYARVLANPRAMPKNLEFEALLSVAEAAFRRKTGRTPVFERIICYDTFQNKDGWNSEP